VPCQAVTSRAIPARTRSPVRTSGVRGAKSIGSIASVARGGPVQPNPVPKTAAPDRCAAFGSTRHRHDVDPDLTGGAELSIACSNSMHNGVDDASHIERNDTVIQAQRSKRGSLTNDTHWREARPRLLH